MKDLIRRLNEAWAQHYNNVKGTDWPPVVSYTRFNQLPKNVQAALLKHERTRQILNQQLPDPPPVTPEPIPVSKIRHSYITKNIVNDDGSVVNEKWCYTYTDEKLTDKTIESTTVITPPVEPTVEEDIVEQLAPQKPLEISIPVPPPSPMICSVKRQNITGLIAVDFWYNPKKGVRYTNWANNLTDELNKHRWDHMINACYKAKIDYNDLCVWNTLCSYNWSGNFDRDIMSDFVENIGNNHLPPNLKNVGPNRQFLLFSIESFIKNHTRFCPNVKNWLVVGTSWQMCVHNRPIGLRNLSKIKDQYNLKIYGSPSGFYGDGKRVTDHNFKTDNTLEWTKVDTDLYQLV